MKEIVEDVFTNLPDEILGCIISFLPNEYSLQTTLISTRWRNLWNQILVKHGTIQDITTAVAHFLTDFDEFDPLKRPRKLQFHFDDDSTLFATIATNSKLLLDFSFGNQKLEREYELEFNLTKQHFTYNLFPPSTFLVKSLTLKSISYLTSEVASSIVSNLEHLESLMITDCCGLQSLFIESETKLHKLTILDCLQLKSLHLRTSKLKCFRYRGPLPRIWPESHFNLSHANLDFRQGLSCSDLKAQDFDETLLTIKNSEILTLCQWTFEVLIWPSISPLSGNFIFYRLKELWWIENHENKNSISALVSFLKLCPALERLFIMIDSKSYSAPKSNSGLMEAIKYIELEQLKLVKFMGFTNPMDEISMAKQLIQPPKIET
ncbi:F-box protein At2g39490-like [Vicia villosa]|uniref:F-box protein At2g39490-like n=1 Tax=Vicia villosa TaxID=3911 RepID=UPI00273AF7CF|nr:F-box protein At2g39490-like [Vicia villosa]